MSLRIVYWVYNSLFIKAARLVFILSNFSREQESGKNKCSVA